jgi:hypothetical protein
MSTKTPKTRRRSLGMKPALINPTEFELRVKRYVELSADGRLEEFKTVHRDVVSSADGDYEIDITARFRALEVAFLVLIECKCHSYSIKREVVQVLYAKMESTGAQKGILFSVTPFQKGAIRYAQCHGIALAQLIGTDPAFETRTSEKDPMGKTSTPNTKLYIATIATDGSISYNPRVVDYLSTYLGVTDIDI